MHLTLWKHFQMRCNHFIYNIDCEENRLKYFILVAFRLIFLLCPESISLNATEYLLNDTSRMKCIEQCGQRDGWNYCIIKSDKGDVQKHEWC